MSPIQIALIIILGVGALAACGTVVQQMENKKQAKKLRLMHLRTSIRRCAHILENVPPHFMSTELHQVLSRYLEFQCKASLEIETSSYAENMLAEINNNRNKSFEPQPHPEGSMTLFPTSHSALRAQAIIKELANFLTSIKGKGEVSSSICDRLLEASKLSYQRCEMDSELHQAIEAEEYQPAKMTIHLYRSIFGKLSKINVDHVVDRQLYELRAHLRHLAEQIEDKEQSPTSTKKAPEQSSTEPDALQTEAPKLQP